MQPGDEKVETKNVTESDYKTRSKVRASERNAPGKSVVIGKGGSSNFLNFILRDVSFFQWCIAIPAIPGNTPNDTHYTQEIEGSAPTIARLNRHYQKRSKCT